MSTREAVIVPEVTELTRPYWNGAAAGALMLQRCVACGAYRHPPTVVCGACGAWETSWVPASGGGVIYSYTVVVHPVHRAVERLVPYNVVLVELDEGVRVVSTVVDAAPDALAIGRRVTAVFERLTPDIGLPKFRLADAPS